MTHRYLMMLGSSDPIKGDGALWQAVDGEPPYRRISHVTAETAPDPGRVPAGTEVWVGRLRFTAGDRLEPPESSGGLLVFAQEPRPGDEEEFDDWMDTEHVPALGSVEGVLMAHRYEAVVGTPRFAALYYMVEPGVCTSDRWREASRTPWRDRMSTRNQNRRRGLYMPVGGA